MWKTKLTNDMVEGIKTTPVFMYKFYILHWLRTARPIISNRTYLSREIQTV
jgi:hypothetical protein